MNSYFISYYTIDFSEPTFWSFDASSDAVSEATDLFSSVRSSEDLYILYIKDVIKMSFIIFIEYWTKIGWMVPTDSFDIHRMLISNNSKVYLNYYYSCYLESYYSNFEYYGLLLNKFTPSDQIAFSFMDTYFLCLSKDYLPKDFLEIIYLFDNTYYNPFNILFLFYFLFFLLSVVPFFNPKNIDFYYYKYQSYATFFNDPETHILLDHWYSIYDHIIVKRYPTLWSILLFNVLIFSATLTIFIGEDHNIFIDSCSNMFFYDSELFPWDLTLEIENLYIDNVKVFFFEFKTLFNLCEIDTETKYNSSFIDYLLLRLGINNIHGSAFYFVIESYQDTFINLLLPWTWAQQIFSYNM